MPAGSGMVVKVDSKGESESTDLSVDQISVNSSKLSASSPTDEQDKPKDNAEEASRGTRTALHALMVRRAAVPQLLCVATLSKVSVCIYGMHQPFINDTFFMNLELVKHGYQAEHLTYTELCTNHAASVAAQAAVSAACQEAPVRATLWHAYLFFVTAFAALIWGVVTGRCADSFGRRPLMVVALFGELLPMIPDFLHLHYGLSLWWYFGVSVAVGVVIYRNMMEVSINAAIADLLPPEHRTFAMGFEAAGWPMAILVGGLISNCVDSQSAIFVSIVLGTVLILWVLLLIPETLDKSLRKPFEISKILTREANPLSGLSVLLRTRDLTLISLIALVQKFGIISMATVGTQFSISTLGFTRRELTLKLLVLGFSGCFFAIVVPSPLKRCIGFKKAVLLAMALMSAQLFAYGFSTSIVMALIVAACSVHCVLSPLLNSAASEQVGPDEQGHMQGAMNTGQSVVMGFGSVLCAWIFKRSQGDGAWIHFSGGVFALAGLVVAMSLPLGCMLSRDAGCGKRGGSETGEASEGQSV